MVVGDCEEQAVRFAGMVNETGRRAHMFSVANVRGRFVVAGGGEVRREFVKVEEVDCFMSCLVTATELGFVVRDDFAAVCVDELPFLKIGCAT